MSAPAPPPAPEIPYARRFSTPGCFAWCFAPSLVGLALAMMFQLWFMLPRFGTGSSDLNRMVALGQHVRSTFPPNSAIALGDSVTVEGIDASIVRSAAPSGWHVENAGINGCDRAEVAVILPAVLAAKPRALILVLRPLSIARPPPISGDGAFAYALGGFRDHWPDGWLGPDSAGLTQDLFDRLTAPRLRAEIHFRTAVNYLINDTLRERVRSGIKFARPDDWVAPFNMTTSISGKTLDAHLKNLEEEVRESSMKIGSGDGPLVIDTTADEADMERLIAAIRAAGATPVLIASPVHPRLRDAEAFAAVGARLRMLAPRWAQTYGGVYADASSLLDETGFADGQHLNAAGRAKLSEFVGRYLPPLSNAPAGTPGM